MPSNKKIEDFYIKIFLTTCSEMDSVEAIQSAKRSWKILGPNEKRIIEDKFNIHYAQLQTKITATLNGGEYYRTHRSFHADSRDELCFPQQTHAISQDSLHEQVHPTPAGKTQAQLPSLTQHDTSSNLELSPQHSLHAEDTLISGDASPQTIKYTSRKRPISNINSVETCLTVEQYQHNSSFQNEPAELYSTDTTNLSQDNPGLLGPPLPPPIRTGRQLFLMVTGKTETDWLRLNNREKTSYKRAILLIKKEYLSRYVKYLHTLSDAQLCIVLSKFTD